MGGSVEGVVEVAHGYAWEREVGKRKEDFTHLLYRGRNKYRQILVVLIHRGYRR